MFYGKTQSFRDEILNRYACPNTAANGVISLKIDDNAGSHGNLLAEDYLQSHDLEIVELSPNLNPEEHVWDYLDRQVTALSTPPSFVT